ncbi:MAG: class I SAM-dependent methyltransferase [Planctomycetota bacterium]
MSLKRAWRRWRVSMAPDGDEVLRMHRELEGQLAMEEVQLLYRGAQGKQTIVEIGSFRGKSCVVMALGSQEVGGHVTAIDPHLSLDPVGDTDYNAEDLEVFNTTIEKWGVADRVTHIVERSHEARANWKDTPIDLLWIDGDHSYEGVKLDLDDWSDLVSPGGLIACHDYTHRESVRQAWSETIERGGNDQWEVHKPVRSIISATRK